MWSRIDTFFFLTSILDKTVKNYSLFFLASCQTSSSGLQLTAENRSCDRIILDTGLMIRVGRFLDYRFTDFCNIRRFPSLPNMAVHKMTKLEPGVQVQQDIK